MEQVPDWYELLHVKPDATLDEIRKAFKKRTIETHPDRNQSNPKAQELFIQVRKAWEVLSDEKARAAFDAVLKVKAARLQREREMDVKRKTMRDDLFARENAFKKQRLDEERAKANFEAEMDRLKREGWRKFKEQEEERDTQAAQPATTFGTRPAPQVDTSRTSIKVTWNRKKMTYDAEKLRSVFSKFGELVFIKAKSKSAIVVFARAEDAAEAEAAVAVGDTGKDLDVKWTEDKPAQRAAPAPTPSVSSAAATSHAFPPTAPAQLAAHLQAEAHDEFEFAVLAKMRAAATKQQQLKL